MSNMTTINDARNISYTSTDEVPAEDVVSPSVVYSIVTETRDKLVFDYEADVKTANNLRRKLIGGIPSMAITSANFSVNTSVFDDEYIERRLTLIPLTLDAREYEDSDIVILNIDATGSKRSQFTTVYSSEINGDFKNSVVVYDKIPVIFLAPDQQIKATLRVKKGKGSQHARWQVSCPVGYKKINNNTFRLTINSTGVYTAREILDIALAE